MGIQFFIVGGVIFATYMGLTIWNIIYSNRKQKEENYPATKSEVDKKGLS
jgi:arginine exporter protein ArgO